MYEIYQTSSNSKLNPPQIHSNESNNNLHPSENFNSKSKPPSPPTTTSTSTSASASGKVGQQSQLSPQVILVQIPLGATPGSSVRVPGPDGNSVCIYIYYFVLFYFIIIIFYYSLM